MKSKFTSTTLIAVLLLLASNYLVAQDNKSTDLKEFKFVVVKTKSGLTLEGLKGCAWTELSFSRKNHNPQAIDEYGMADLKNLTNEKDLKLVDFLFTIEKTKDGILLKGIEGTAWTRLSFSLSNNVKQAVNQYGMTDL